MAGVPPGVNLRLRLLLVLAVLLECTHAVAETETAACESAVERNNSLFIWSSSGTASTLLLNSLASSGHYQGGSTFEPGASFLATAVVSPGERVVMFEDLQRRLEPQGGVTTYQQIVDEFETRADLGPFVIKEHAAYLQFWGLFVNHRQWLARKHYTHVFLIREPRAALYSTARRMYPNFWPPENPAMKRVYLGMAFDFEDPADVLLRLGVKSQWQLFHYLTEIMNVPCIVLQAEDMLTKPESTMRALADALGIPFDDSFMAWDGLTFSEPIQPWQNAWVKDLAKSTGFIKGPSKGAKAAPNILPVQWKEAVDRATAQSRRYYEDLKLHALSV